MFKDKRTGVWQTKIKGRQISLGTKDKKLAREIETVKKADILKGHAGIVTKFDLTVNEGYAKYKSSLKDERGDPMRFERKTKHLDWIYNKHIRSEFGDKKMLLVTCKDVHDWASGLEDVSPALANRVVTILRATYKFCMQPMSLKKPMPHDPIMVWPRFKEKFAGRRATQEEIAILQQSTDPVYLKIKPMALLALNTGLRRENLQRLQWSWLDFGNELIVIPASETKSGNELRIPLLSAAREILETQKGQHPVFVFTRPDGQPWKSPNTISRIWKSAMTRIGINHSIRLHDTRHTCGTLMVESGISTEAVKSFLGHADIRTTQRYVHMSQADMKAKLKGWGVSCQPNVNRNDRKMEEMVGKEVMRD